MHNCVVDAQGATMCAIEHFAASPGWDRSSAMWVTQARDLQVSKRPFVWIAMPARDPVVDAGHVDAGRICVRTSRQRTPNDSALQVRPERISDQATTYVYSFPCDPITQAGMCPGASPFWIAQTSWDLWTFLLAAYDGSKVGWIAAEQEESCDSYRLFLTEDATEAATFGMEIEPLEENMRTLAMWGDINVPRPVLFLVPSRGRNACLPVGWKKTGLKGTDTDGKTYGFALVGAGDDYAVRPDLRSNPKMWFYTRFLPIGTSALSPTTSGPVSAPWSQPLSLATSGPVSAPWSQPRSLVTSGPVSAPWSQPRSLVTSGPVSRDTSQVTALSKAQATSMAMSTYNKGFPIGKFAYGFVGTTVDMQMIRGTNAATFHLDRNPAPLEDPDLVCVKDSHNNNNIHVGCSGSLSMSKAFGEINKVCIKVSQILPVPKYIIRNKIKDSDTNAPIYFVTINGNPPKTNSEIARGIGFDELRIYPDSRTTFPYVIQISNLNRLNYTVTFGDRYSIDNIVDGNHYAVCIGRIVPTAAS